MKNHKTARALYLENTRNEMGDNTAELRKLLSPVLDKAESLKDYMINIGISCNELDAKTAISLLEYVYEQEISDARTIMDYSKFNIEWSQTNRDDLFDQVFNSAYSTAKQKNNEALLQYLKIYKDYTVSHVQANTLYNAKDQDKEFLNMVTNKIHDAPNSYTLKGLMRDLGRTFAHDDEPEDAIILLEAIYDALGKERSFIEEHERISIDDKTLPLTEDNKLNNDALFYEAFYSMYKVGVQHNDKDLLGKLKEYYPELEHL